VSDQPPTVPSSWETMSEHLGRHRDRCGVGPVLVLRCECGEAEVLLCARCHRALLTVTRDTRLCEHGRLLLEGEEP
jgi:hypothetical protein